MLDELLKEINALKQYKEKYESANKDKEKMSKLIYEYMMKEYESMTKEERFAKYKNECCSCCRYNVCNYNLPDNIMKPIPSKEAWIPARVCCSEFEWA